MNRWRPLAGATAMLMLGTGVSLAAASVASAHVTTRGIAGHASHGPRIVARPDKLMVNRYTVLTGTGFKPHKRLTIEECSTKSWVVPLMVCNHRNTVQVRTSAGGRFRVKFKALVCPAIRRAIPAKGFERTCWVGVPAIAGVDVVTLRGAAKIIVTGP